MKRFVLLALLVPLLPGHEPPWTKGEEYRAKVIQGVETDYCREPGWDGFWRGRILDEYGRTDSVRSPWPLEIGDRVRCTVTDVHDPSLVISQDAGEMWREFFGVE